MQDNPAIVISAYNRPESLKRLLHSLERAVYPGDEISLIISIDKSDVTAVEALAASFEWKHGPKKILLHPAHIGLKAHILKCGELTRDYQSIILLEDDLVVSPYFYDYSKKALAFYQNDRDIAGISLYNYQVAESCLHPFTAVDDGSDVYFMQVASSWGQLWTKEQWLAFARWFAEHPELPQHESIPGYLHRWGRHSWKKHFIHYLIDTSRYFVFPRLSLSTNFEDHGTHATATGIFQVPLQTAAKDHVFQTRNTSGAIYDAWFELLPSCMNRLNPRLQDFDYSVDLYGTKNPSLFKSKYILSSRKAEVPLLSFDIALFPAETNIALNLQGQHIGLYKIQGAVFTDQKLPLGKQLPARKKEERFVISVVIPVETPDPIALAATLDSVALQKYGNKECIIVTTAATVAMAKQTVEKYTLDVKIAIAPASALADLVTQGLTSAAEGLLTWLLPGSTFAADAFSKAASIFEGNAGISWIRGIDEDGSEQLEHARLNTLHYRLTQNEAYRRLKSNTLGVSTELDFFRRHCISPGAQASFSSLFFDLLSSYQLIVVITRLGTRRTNALQAIPDSERHALLTKYAHFKTSTTWQKNLFSFLLKTPFFGNASRQWVYAALHNLPDVLRYDAIHRTFYFHKY